MLTLCGLQSIRMLSHVGIYIVSIFNAELDFSILLAPASKALTVLE